MKIKKSIILTDRQTDRQTELSNCNFVKTILMLTVVMYHSIVFWTGNWFADKPIFSSEILSIFARWMNTFHIYGFSLVSGYLFFFLKYEKGKYSRFIPFLINKIKRLLIPYAFVSAVWVIPFAIYFYNYNAKDIILRFLLGTSPSQLWFLLMLFDVFIIFYPLSNFFKSHNIYGTIVVITFYGLGLVGQTVFPNVFQLFRACTYIPLFWLGFKIRQYDSYWLRRIPIWLYLLADILLFVGVQFLSNLNGNIFALLKLGSDFLLHIVGALMAFVVLQNIANCIKWKNNNLFGFLSKNSMPIYLFHQQIIYVFIRLLNGILNPYMHATVNFLGAILISLLISFLMMKFKWTKILIGEK